MTDKPQQPKHDDRVEGRPEPRAVASASFDNGLTLPSSNDTLKRKMQLPSNEEAVESTPHLQLAVAPEPSAAAVAPVADNKVVAPLTAPASLSRVSATGDFNADSTAVVGTPAIKPAFTATAALPGADGKEPGKFSTAEPVKFTAFGALQTNADTLAVEKPGTKTFTATSNEMSGKVFTATDSGGFFNKFVELGTKHPKSMDEGVAVSDKGGRSATQIGKLVTMVADDIITGTKRVKVADDGHPDRKPKDRDAGGFFGRLFEADKPRKRRDDDDNNGNANGRKRKKDNDDDGQHPPRKRRDDDGDGPPKKRKPDDDAPPKKPKGDDNNNNGKKHKKDDVPGPKHADVPPPKLPPAPPGDAHGGKPAATGNGKGVRPGGGGGADGQGDDGHGGGGGGGRGRHGFALRDFQNNLDKLSSSGSSGKGGRDHVSPEPGDKHAAAKVGGAVGRGLPALGAPGQHGDGKHSAVPTSTQRGTEHTRIGSEIGTGHGGKHAPVESKTHPVRPEVRADNHHGDGSRNAGGHGRPGTDAHGGGELRTRHGMDAQKIAQLPDLRTILRPDNRGQKAEPSPTHGGERTAQSDAVHRGGLPHQVGRAGIEGASGAHDAGSHRVDARLDILENTRRNLDQRQEQVGGRRNGEEFTVRANGNERGAARGPAAENNTGRTHSGERSTDSANKTERNNEGGENIPGDRNAAGRAHTAPTTSAEEEEARKKNRRLLQQEDDPTQFVPEETRTPDEEELPGTIHVQHAFVPTERSEEEEEGKEEELETALSDDEQRQRQLALLAASGNNDPSQQQSQQQNQQGSSAGANGGGTVVDPDAVLPSVEIVGNEGLHHSGHHAHSVPDQQIIATEAVVQGNLAHVLGQHSPHGAHVSHPGQSANAPDALHQPDTAHAHHVAHSPVSAAHQPYASEDGATQSYDSGDNAYTNYGAAVAGAALNGSNQDEASPTQFNAPPTQPFDAPATQFDAPPLAAQDLATIVADSSQYVEAVTEELPAYQQDDWHVVGALDVEQRREIELSAYEDHAAAMKAMRDAEVDAYDLREKQQREERERLEAERDERERREAEREERERREEEARVRRQRELDEYQRKLILLNNKGIKGGEYPDMPRVKYVVQTGDTLESIAVKRFRDKRIAQLIFELNKRTIPTRSSGNKTFLTLKPGTSLFLPNHQDIKTFYSRRPALMAFGYDVADPADATQPESAVTAADGGSRRANIEKLLGTIGNATTKPESATCVVRLGDSLNSLAKRVLKDPTLWLLLAETNGLSADCDDSGQSTIRLQRGTTLVLPTNEQITEFNRRLKEAAGAADETRDGATTVDATTIDSSTTRITASELTTIARDIADVCREYVFLREGVRLAVCLNKATGTEMNIALEVEIEGQWTVAYSYEQRCADKWYRNKFDAQGRVTRLPLDLPDRIAIELAQNDLYCDWETYADEYLESMRFSLRA